MAYMFFLVIVPVLIFICTVLILELRRSKLRHLKKITLLEEIIVHLTENHRAQLVKARLSDEFNASLKQAETVLVNDIYDLQKEFLRILNDKNLL